MARTPKDFPGWIRGGCELDARSSKVPPHARDDRLTVDLLRLYADGIEAGTMKVDYLRISCLEREKEPAPEGAP